MTRVLDLIAFWRKKRNSSSTKPSRSHKPVLLPLPQNNQQTIRPIDHSNQPSSSTHYPQQFQPSSTINNQSLSLSDPPPATFLVPDLDDIRPFLQQSSSNPISMRDLLNAISSSSANAFQNHLNPFHTSSTTHPHHPLNVQLNKNPLTTIYQQFSIKSKRKFDQHSTDDDQTQDQNLSSSQRSRLNSNRSAASFRVNQLPSSPLGSSSPFKRPRLITNNLQDQIGEADQIHQVDSKVVQSSHPTNQSIPSKPPQSRPPPKNSYSIQLIHGLPSHAWSQIFHYNQLSTLQALIPVGNCSQVPNPSSIGSSKILSNQLQLALEAQEHRHSLIRLSKSLAPIAKKAAWSTLVLGTARMIDQVAQRLEADNPLASHIEACITIIIPSRVSGSSPLSTDSPHQARYSVASDNSPCNHRNPPRPTPIRSLNQPPQPSIRKKPPSHLHTPNRNHNARDRQSLPMQKHLSVTPSSSRPVKKCERFQSVLIPSLPPSKKLETSRNTKLNSLRIYSTLANQDVHQSNILEDENDQYLEEIILAGSLPSLFLSIARSIKICCIMGDERLGTRALKSLSVLPSLLGGLNELYIDGGGQLSDLSTLIDGLRSMTIRGSKGASLKVISITGPLSTLSIGSEPSVSAPSSRISSYSSSSMFQSTNSSSFSKSITNNPNHISVQHLILGTGIPLTPERFHWLVNSATEQSASKGLKSLKVCLRSEVVDSSLQLPNLSSSVSSIGSTSTHQTRKTLSSRALLSRAFERIGPSLEKLNISEDWSCPLTSSHGGSAPGQANRRVTFEDHSSPEGQGLLDEPIAFCSRLESLSLTDGPLCSIGLLKVLPFTLKIIEIFDVGIGGLSSDSNYLETKDQDHFNVGFEADDIWMARSQAALFGLEKIRLISGSSSMVNNNHLLFKKWKKNSSSQSSSSHHSRNGLEKLEKVGVQIEFVSSSPFTHHHRS